jgi:hypothetical protein
VTASEIAAFAYCAKAWHLQYVQKAQPTLDALSRRAEGVRQHEHHGRLIGMQGRLERRRIALTSALVLLAFLAIVGLFLAS